MFLENRVICGRNDVVKSLFCHGFHVKGEGIETVAVTFGSVIEPYDVGAFFAQGFENFYKGCRSPVVCAHEGGIDSVF